MSALEVMKKAAAEEAVGCLPGIAFGTNASANEKYQSNIRLTFVRYDEHVIAEGIARLGRILKTLV